MLTGSTENEDSIIIDCPSDQTVNAESGASTATATWSAPTTSDMSGMVTLTSDHDPGDTFPLGPTTVTYTATDSSGNTVSSCTFVITVVGKEL